jgi:ADP-ribosylglycohydrolase
MLGAIAGDIIGSVYEFNNINSKEFELFHPAVRFTDDTVLTVALAESILTGDDYLDLVLEYYHRYPDAGYGSRFRQWAERGPHTPDNSWGNGSALRVSPVGFAYDDLELVLVKAEESAAITHNHPEGVKGAQATAAAIFLARSGHSKARIKRAIEQRFGYDLSTPLAQIRPHYGFDVSCQGTVPQAIRAFLEADDWEDAIRNAISLGGDSDTLACITGGIAEAAFGLPDDIAARALAYLDPGLRAIQQRFAALLRGPRPARP